MKQKSIGVLGLNLFCFSVKSNIYCQSIGLVDVKYAEQVITIGGPDADIPGFTSVAIQIALDAIKTRGGETHDINITNNIIRSAGKGNQSTI